MTMKRQKLHSIVKNLTASLTAAVMSVSLIIIIAFSLYEFIKSRKELEDKSEKSIKYLRKILELPLWNIDNRTIKIIGQTYSLDKSVTALSITDGHGRLIYNLKRDQGRYDTKKKGIIFHNGEKIGEIGITFSYSSYLYDLIIFIRNLVIINLLIIISIFLAANFLIRYFLITPLKQFSGIVDSYASGNYDLKNDFTPAMEFEQFKKVLENMGMKIVEQLDDLKMLNSSLEKNSGEKDMLIRELYHRTKNNMQVINALIRLKTMNIRDEKTKSILDDISNKIFSISLVHKKLFRSNDLSNINFGEYIKDLADNMIGGGKIIYELNCDETNILFDIAVPAGLVINELITNSLKYAFPDNRKGIIKINVMKNGGRIVVEYSDNGTGLPDGFDPDKTESFGFISLIAIIREQLGGEINWDSDNGFNCRFSFSPSAYIKRI